MIDRNDVRVVVGIALVVGGVYVLLDVHGLAGVAVLVGGWLVVNGVLGGR